MNMKKICLLVLCLCLVGLSAGCQNTKTRMGEGAVIGGVLGAAAGGIIGHQSHHGAEGAAIGAATGAVTGAIVGSQIEKKPKEPTTAQTSTLTQTQTTQLQEQETVANPNQMSMQQIIELTKQGIDDNVIIDKIRLSNSQFNLTEDDIAYLRQEGVSEEVIGAMQGK